MCATYFESQQNPLWPIDRLCMWARTNLKQMHKIFIQRAFSEGIFVAYFFSFRNSDRQQKAQTNFLALISSRHTCHHTFRMLTDALLFAIDLSTCVIVVSDAKWTHVECRTAEVKALMLCFSSCTIIKLSDCDFLLHINGAPSLRHKLIVMTRVANFSVL